MDNIKPMNMLISPMTEGRISTDKANKIYNVFRMTARSEKSVNTCFQCLPSFKMILLIKCVRTKYIKNTTAKMRKSTMNVITSGIIGGGPGGAGLSNAVIIRKTKINDNVDNNKPTEMIAVDT